MNFPCLYRTKYQEIWANNGDALSRQYAGTAALKGDFTRTGDYNYALFEAIVTCHRSQAPTCAS